MAGRLEKLCARGVGLSRRPVVFALDLVLVGAAAAALVILVTGGGRFWLFGHEVQALRARNPLAVVFLLAPLRYLLRGWAPLLAIPALGLGFLPERLAGLCRSLEAWLRALTPSQAWRVLARGLLASGALKAWNAWHYYGFAYGDDVEIHVMTFSALFHRDLGVWQLRSPFYPLCFIYPVQWLLVSFGVSDPAILIFGGRLVVVGFSLLNVWLTYRLVSRLFSSVPVGLLAALLLATGALHIHLGSSELPRTVASSFLLATFLLIAEAGGAGRAALAGACLGIGASLRFSEAVFGAPFCLLLLWERRWRDLGVALLAACGACALILGPGDLLYWPSMFTSLRQIVDYTLVKGESSHGFEPAAYYLLTLFSWTDVFTVVLALWSLRRPRRDVLVWLTLPILLLSAFPHKEERYLVPVLPFLAIAAARGLWDLLQGVRQRPPGIRHALVLYLLAGALLFELEDFRFRRSEEGVDAVRFLAATPDVRDVAMEAGASEGAMRLYLGSQVNLTDIDPDQIRQRVYFWGFLERPDAQYVVLKEDTISACGYRPMLRDEGFVEVPLDGHRRGGRFRVFRLRKGAEG